MEQRTDAWLEWRRKHVCASEAPVIMGVAKYSTILDWWRDKMGLPPTKERNTYIMDKGNALEPIARARYSLLKNVEMEPALYEHSKYPLFAASLDGANATLKRGLEIKYLGREDFANMFLGIVPVRYVPQVQAQLFVTGFKSIDFFGYHLPKECNVPELYHRGRSLTISVEPDLAMIAEYKQRGEFYWDFVVRGVEPPYEKPARKARAKKCR